MGGPDALAVSVGWGGARNADAWGWAKGIRLVVLHPAGKELAKCQGNCLHCKRNWAQPQVIISVVELWSRKTSEQRISIAPFGLEPEPSGFAVI